MARITAAEVIANCTVARNRDVLTGPKESNQAATARAMLKRGHSEQEVIAFLFNLPSQVEIDGLRAKELASSPPNAACSRANASEGELLQLKRNSVLKWLRTIASKRDT